VFERLSLSKSIPKRATERTQPSSRPLQPSHLLQPSSHLLSNVLVFISQLNKCLFLKHARTHTHTHTHNDFSHPMNCPKAATQQHFLRKAFSSVLVAGGGFFLNKLFIAAFLITGNITCFTLLNSRFTCVFYNINYSKTCQVDHLHKMTTCRC
jgi:hypothetical protein